VGDIIDELNFQNEPISSVMTFSNETALVSVQFHDTPAPSLFARSISTSWSPPSEFSKSAINEFFNSMSVTQSTCLFEYDLLDGLVFTNKGFDIGDYNDDEVCVYRIYRRDCFISSKFMYKNHHKFILMYKNLCVKLSIGLRFLQ